MAGLNHDGRRDVEAGRKPGDFHLDVLIEAVNSVRTDGEFFAAPRINNRIGPGDGYFEIRFGLANNQSIGKSFATVSTCISNPDEVFPIVRRLEQQSGICPELAVAIVVISVIERKNRQSVRLELS